MRADQHGLITLEREGEIVDVMASSHLLAATPVKINDVVVSRWWLRAWPSESG